MRRPIVLLFAILLSLPLQALSGSNPFVFDNFSGKTELFFVQSMLRQKDGMLWFGTDAGLYGFDGYDRDCPKKIETFQQID